MNTAQEITNNTYKLLSSLFEKQNEWTKNEILAVMMDINNVYNGGRVIQKWLDVKVDTGQIILEDDIYKKMSNKKVGGQNE